MWNRRDLLICVASVGAYPSIAFGQDARFRLNGALKPGELIVGQTEKGTEIRLGGKALRVSAAGAFAFGFPYNEKKPATLAFRFADGQSVSHEIVPTSREYEIQRISGLPPALVAPPQDLLDRLKREGEAINRARSHDTDSVWFSDPFDWPVPGIVSSLFGSQRILNGEPRAPHLAVDIAAPTGTPIRAPADGIVSLVGDFYLDGGFTILDHGHGVSTCYGHQSKQLVTEGEKIVRGQIIGEVGQTGRATGPNLHWGMAWFQTGLDPSLSTPTPRPERT